MTKVRKVSKRRSRGAGWGNGETRETCRQTPRPIGARVAAEAPPVSTTGVDAAGGLVCRSAAVLVEGGQRHNSCPGCCCWWPVWCQVVVAAGEIANGCGVLVLPQMFSLFPRSASAPLGFPTSTSPPPGQGQAFSHRCYGCRTNPSSDVTTCVLWSPDETRPGSAYHCISRHKRVGNRTSRTL